jgi:hypothetical protein
MRSPTAASSPRRGPAFALACSVSCSFRAVFGGNRLIATLRALATSSADLELRSLPSTSVTQLPRYYGPLRHPTRPSLSLAGVRLELTRLHRGGFPCCERSPCADMPSPLPRWDRRWDRVAPLEPATAAFPDSLTGRLPHWTFRGLRGVHMLRPACSRGPQRTLSIEGFGSFVTSTTAPIATG